MDMKTLGAGDIQIRDPFVYLEKGVYYLYGTTDKDPWKAPGEGFLCYQSDDLRRFERPVRVFTPPPGFWGTHNFWAPELHAYEGKYYLFASFKAQGRARATAILRADSPLGPFLPWGAEQVTPEGWECLDGTLHVDGAGQPFLVFCHEWVQEGGGTVCAKRLKRDLSGAEGEVMPLFAAQDAHWAKSIRHSSGVTGFVTDGPFLFSGREKLFMLWSSFTGAGYALGLSISQTGTVQGPWAHLERPLYEGDGGHGMLFPDKAGGLNLSLHAPNKTPLERPRFFPVRDRGCCLTLDDMEAET